MSNRSEACSFLEIATDRRKQSVWKRNPRFYRQYCSARCVRSFAENPTSFSSPRPLFVTSAKCDILSGELWSGVTGQRICNSALVLLHRVDFSLANRQLQQKRAHMECVLHSGCSAKDRWSIFFLGREPRLHSTLPLPHTSYKDTVSFRGAAQPRVLRKCRLICLWFEVSSLAVLSKNGPRKRPSQLELMPTGLIFVFSVRWHHCV